MEKLLVSTCLQSVVFCLLNLICKMTFSSLPLLPPCFSTFVSFPYVYVICFAQNVLYPEANLNAMSSSDRPSWKKSPCSVPLWPVFPALFAYLLFPPQFSASTSLIRTPVSVWRLKYKGQLRAEARSGPLRGLASPLPPFLFFKIYFQNLKQIFSIIL